MTVEIIQRNNAAPLAAAASDTSTSTDAVDVDAEGVMSDVFEEAVYGASCYYGLYYFTGNVSSNGLISEFVLGKENYAAFTGDEWTLASDIEYLSEAAIENIDDGTTPGITPMYAAQYPGGSNEAAFNIEAAALFDYSSDGYPYAYGIGTEGSHYAWTLSEEEEGALEEKYDRGSGTLSEDLDNLIEDMAEDLLNYFGTLLEPVINFHKTKNKKITDKQLSALGSEDVTASTTSIDVMSTPTEYEEPEEP